MYHLRRIGKPATLAGVQNMLRLTSDVTRIGRHSENDFFLDSSVLTCYISRWHAEVHIIEQDDSVKFMLRDNSLNGTYVNDYRIKGNHILEPGDEVTFGHPNGRSVRPGQHAPQGTSEFLFLFEASQDNEMSAKDEIMHGASIPIATLQTDKDQSGFVDVTPGMSALPLDSVTSRRIFPESPSNLPLVLKDITKVHNITSAGGLVRLDNLLPTQEPEETYSDGTDNSLMDIANSVQARINISDSESDEDIFDLSYGTTMASAGKSGSLFCARQIKGTKASPKKTVRKSGRRKKRKLNEDFVSDAKQLKGRKKKKVCGRSEEDDMMYHTEGEPCSAPCCLLPKKTTITWVQCDDCDSWFHADCVRCRYDIVHMEEDFHCGCV